MGSGRWDTNVYDTAAKHRVATGTSAFAFSDATLSRSRTSWKVHNDLDPFGVAIRESRDSDEHPESLAIAVLFDVTGSMGRVPQVLQTKLPALFGLLLRKGYVEHPQILFGGIGDATCDRVPLQVGQFESDNRMDEQLGNIILEGGGGGQMTESYELAMYFMTHHTALDCFEKRGKRGYLFIIGDEMAYPKVKRAEVASVIGDTFEQSIETAKIVTELTEKFDVYYILPAGASYVGDSRVLSFWRNLLGQNVIQLDDLNAVCETIALTIGLGEGTIDLDEGIEDLYEVSASSVKSVGRALATVGASSGGSIVSTDAPDGLDDFGDDVDRL